MAAHAYNAVNAIRGSKRHRWARMGVCRGHTYDGPCMAAQRIMHVTVLPASPGIGCICSLDTYLPAIGTMHIRYPIIVHAIYYPSGKNTRRRRAVSPSHQLQ